MTIISKTEPLKQKEIEVSDLEETGIDNEKLAALKAKMASKENTKLTVNCRPTVRHFKSVEK